MKSFGIESGQFVLDQGRLGEVESDNNSTVNCRIIISGAKYPLTSRHLNIGRVR